MFLITEYLLRQAELLSTCVMASRSGLKTLKLTAARHSPPSVWLRLWPDPPNMAHFQLASGSKEGKKLIFLLSMHTIWGDSSQQCVKSKNETLTLVERVCFPRLGMWDWIEWSEWSEWSEQQTKTSFFCDGGSGLGRAGQCHVTLLLLVFLN